MRKIIYCLLLTLATVLMGLIFTGCEKETTDLVSKSITETIQSVPYCVAVKGPYQGTIKKEPYYFEIKNQKELENFIERYKLKYEDPKEVIKIDNNFFEKNKIFLVLRDGCPSSGKWSLNKVEKSEDSIKIQFKMLEPGLTDDVTTRGFFVGLSKEFIGEMKKVEITF